MGAKKTYKVYFGAISNANGLSLQGGWYTQKFGCPRINDVYIMRSSNVKDATMLTQQEALGIVKHARNSNLPAKADPPIVITY